MWTIRTIISFNYHNVMKGPGQELLPKILMLREVNSNSKISDPAVKINKRDLLVSSYIIKITHNV